MGRTNTTSRRPPWCRTAAARRDDRADGGSIAVVLVLAVALWMAASLGLAHRVVHTPGVSGVAVRSVVPSGDPGVAGAMAVRAHAHAGGSVFAMLFGAHGDPKDCRLYDQLSGGFATLSVPSAVLPIALPTARFHFFLGEAIDRWVTLFDARGPPASR